MLSSFVAVVANGKSPRVQIAAGLSDPDVAAVRCSIFFSCPDNCKAAVGATEVLANRSVQPILHRALQPISTASANRSSFSSVLYTSTHRISITYNAKLNYCSLTSKHVMV